MRPRPTLSSPSPQTRKPPVAPPVYRPQPVAKTLQRKAATDPRPSKFAITFPGPKLQKPVSKPITNLPVPRHAPKTCAIRLPIQRRVAQLAMAHPAATPAAAPVVVAAAAAPVVPAHKRVEDFHNKLLFAHSIIGRMKRGSNEVDSRILSRIGADAEIDSMSHVLSNVTFDWVTKYNSLTYAKDESAVMADLIDEAEAIDLSQMHARASYLYSLSQQKAAVEVAPTKSRRMSETQRAAAELKAQFPHGPSKSMGKTIGAIIDLDTGIIFVASSGRTAKKLHPKTKTLLAGVHEVEKWPVDACAEVNAIDEHILGGLDPVPGRTHLYSYCYTWDYSKRKWTGRSACLNCRQWLARYK